MNSEENSKVAVVINSEETTRMAFELFLRRNGWKVEMAENGESGLSLIDKLIERGTMPQLAIIAVDAEIRNGLVVARILEAHKIHIPIIFTSPFSLEEPGVLDASTIRHYSPYFLCTTEDNAIARLSTLVAQTTSPRSASPPDVIGPENCPPPPAPATPLIA